MLGYLLTLARFAHAGTAHLPTGYRVQIFVTYVPQMGLQNCKTDFWFSTSSPDGARVCEKGHPLDISKTRRDKKLKIGGWLEDVLRYLTAKGILFPVSTSGFMNLSIFDGTKTGGPGFPLPVEGRNRGWCRSTQEIVLHGASYFGHFLSRGFAARGRQSYPILHFFQCLKNRCEAVLKATTVKIWE